jgi:hypothetical protein
MSSRCTVGVFVLSGVLAVSALTDKAHSQTAEETKQTSRTWTDLSGRHRVEATFVDFKDGKVHMRRNDGTLVDVPIESLSDADWDYVRQQVRAAQGYAVAPPPNKGAIFQEDFSKFGKGDLVNWGEKVHVEPGLDGRNWLAPSENLSHLHAGQKVAFPANSWYLAFDFSAQSSKEAFWDYKGFVPSGISFADENGNVFRVGWQVGPRKHVFIFPDGTTQECATTSIPAHQQKKEDARFWLTGRTLRLEKRGDSITISINGKAVCSEPFRGLGRVVRFDVDTSLKSASGFGWTGLSANDEWICFTNFKVGAL